MQDAPNRSLVVRASVALLLFAALAAAFELIAWQAPGSPLYLGVLPGPLGVLRELSTTLGLLLLGVELLAPRAYAGGPRADLSRSVALMLSTGAWLAVLAQAYGALHGMYGLQLKDLRSDALPMFVLKHAGLLAFICAYAVLGLRVLRAPAGSCEAVPHQPPKPPT